MWTAYTGASLILEKLFSRSSSYEIACFSILASGPHLDATITSQNIFTSSSIDAITFNSGPLIMDVSLVLEKFFKTLIRCGFFSDDPQKKLLFIYLFISNLFIVDNFS